MADLRISDLSRMTDTKVETIRWYEKEGLLPLAPRTSGNYRSYGESHLRRLSFIRRARDLGFSLDDVRELLTLADDRDRSCGAIDSIASRHLHLVDRRIADLEKMREELTRMLGTCRQNIVADCWIIETLGADMSPQKEGE